MGILNKWTPNERAALSRATAKLREKQPEPKQRAGTIHHPDVPGCYYSKVNGCYIINTFIDGLRVTCGTIKEWDKVRACRMQYETENKYKNSITK